MIEIAVIAFVVVNTLAPGAAAEIRPSIHRSYCGNRTNCGMVEYVQPIQADSQSP